MELSPYLLTIGLSWIIAQGLKYLIITLKNRKLSYFRQLYLSGNMPSAHSASTVALATMIGLSEGADSAIFGLAALFAAVVMYDAVMVRRSVGEQGVALETLIRLAKNKSVIIPRAARGHTPLEVLAGAALGVAIGFIVFFATK
jgi:acid phosphatase family membrane protein YuiD